MALMHEQPAGVPVDGGLQVAGVGAERRLGPRPRALGEHAHERLVRVGLEQRGPGVHAVGGRYGP